MTRAEPVKHTRRMSAAKSVGAGSARAETAVMGDGTLWQGTVEAGPESDRLGWPLAAGVILLLSVGLWAGIGWFATALFR